MLLWYTLCTFSVSYFFHAIRFVLENSQPSLLLKKFHLIKSFNGNFGEKDRARSTQKKIHIKFWAVLIWFLFSDVYGFILIEHTFVEKRKQKTWWTCGGMIIPPFYNDCLFGKMQPKPDWWGKLCEFQEKDILFFPRTKFNCAEEILLKAKGILSLPSAFFVSPFSFFLSLSLSLSFSLSLFFSVFLSFLGGEHPIDHLGTSRRLLPYYLYGAATISRRLKSTGLYWRI